MQKIKLRTEESGKKLSAAYAPPKWSETADDDDDDPKRSLGMKPKISLLNKNIGIPNLIF